MQDDKIFELGCKRDKPGDDDIGIEELASSISHQLLGRGELCGTEKIDENTCLLSRTGSDVRIKLTRRYEDVGEFDYIISVEFIKS